jgi:hypothetical protein
MTTQTALPLLTGDDLKLLAEAKETLVGLGRKVEDADLYEYAELVPAAQLYTSTYSGSFEFMQKMASDAAIYGFGKWTAGKYRGVCNCLRAEAIQEQRKAAEAANPAPAVEVKARVPAGTYTAVLGPSHGDHVTIRVKPHWMADEAKKGTMVLQYLSGSDNESSYTGFAFLSGSQVKIWRKFADQVRNDGRLVQALKVIFKDPATAGEAYALESSRCFRCGRKLTVPVSIHRGLGPECYQRWGK